MIDQKADHQSLMDGLSRFWVFSPSLFATGATGKLNQLGDRASCGVRSSDLTHLREIHYPMPQIIPRSFPQRRRTKRGWERWSPVPTGITIQGHNPKVSPAEWECASILIGFLSCSTPSYESFSCCNISKPSMICVSRSTPRRTLCGGVQADHHHHHSLDEIGTLVIKTYSSLYS
jgi:hypothetical protein